MCVSTDLVAPMQFVTAYDEGTSLRTRFFCFSLGFLSVGIFVALSYLGVQACLLMLGMLDENLENTLLSLSLEYAIPAGFFSILLGDFIRQVRPYSHDRWIWLSLLIPMAASLYAPLTGECASLPHNGEQLLDSLRGLAIWQGSALTFGMCVILMIGSSKLAIACAKRFWKSFSEQ